MLCLASLKSISLFGRFKFNSNIRLYSDQKLNPAQAINDVRVKKMRNIGISAHIDSGKTTLTERILYYTGRIKEIHEVKGKDGIGAKMDSMDLEREKGITIQSAATFLNWKGYHINIIDTPGHVDFTIEVERALKVLDGAILVLCAVGSVQSQTYTVDRQMKRYGVPRIVFINKCDRMGADPWKGIAQLKKKLSMNCEAVQIPMGLGNNMSGLIDIIKMKSYTFGGDNGEMVYEDEIPVSCEKLALQKRQELLENLANLDDVVLEYMMEEKPVPEEIIKNAIRSNCISNKFIPVFMGTAIKNKGVQLLLNGVIDYLPSPGDILNEALDANDESTKIELVCDSSNSLVAYPFKLKDDKFGQFTWVRVYQGILKRGDVLFSQKLNKKFKVPRLVRMHSDEIEEIEKVHAGDIAAIIGPEIPIGVTFTDGKYNVVMQSMHVPDSVISYSITSKSKEHDKNMMKALRKFQTEDPTFKVIQDIDTNELLICGMGELHLEIYTERLKREYGISVTVGKPRVAYKETVSAKGNFEYLHKKQTGGQGQFAKICGYLEPIEDDDITKDFVDQTIGGSIPPQYIPAIQKGYEDMIVHGPTCGFPVVDVRMVIENGAYHAVDSSELAFRTATHGAFKMGFENACPQILEPWMFLEVLAPSEFQTSVISGINKRKGVIDETETENEDINIRARVALSSMFGYATEVRSATQGKASFTMEYLEHLPVSKEKFNEIKEKYKENANIIY